MAFMELRKTVREMSTDDLQKAIPVLHFSKDPDAKKVLASVRAELKARCRGSSKCH